jgi:conjugative relaxase-like TrwC/TraI family protein
MTARVTTLKSASAGAYYVEQLPSYYLDSGEPRGVWFGDGAARLGLVGEVDDDAFLAVMAGMDPRQPERALGRRYDDDSVRGFDVTCSAPKSVSVLWALGDERVRAEVLAAHDAAVEAMVGWIERHAHTRYRIGGEVAVVDAEGIVAARFRQHTSRALDPQLHTHVVIANRVASPDGRWLALDARTIKYDQRTLSALYHAGLRAELTDRLGVRWQAPERGIAELDDIPEVVRVEFSQRTGDVERRIAEKLDRFTETMEREPTVRERWRLEREAVVDSRPAKPHGTSASELHSVWSEQVRALGLDPARVVGDAVGIVAPAPLVSRDSVWSDHTLRPSPSSSRRGAQPRSRGSSRRGSRPRPAWRPGS